MSRRPLLATTRGAALAAALGETLGRPLRFLPVLAALSLVLASLLLGGMAAWRLQPFEAPAWVRPQALVLMAGAEGETDLAAAGLALRKVPQVLAADFVGRDAALADLAQRPALAGLGLRELRPNPLPDAFLVTFAADAGPDAVEAAAAELRKVRSVDSVQYVPEAYRRIWALVALARPLVLLATGVLLAAALLGGALLATLRVRLDPDAIRLLDVLGADPAVVRRAPVYAGALGLGLAAALACWLAAVLAARLDPLVADLARHYALHWSADPVPAAYGVAVCAAAAALGAALASIGARLAMRAALS